MAFINVHVNCAVDRGCCPATGQPEKPVTVVVFSVRHRVLFPAMAVSLLVLSFIPRARDQCCVSSSTSDGGMPSSRACLQWRCLCSPLFPDSAAFFGVCFCSAVAVLFRLKGYTTFFAFSCSRCSIIHCRCQHFDMC